MSDITRAVEELVEIAMKNPVVTISPADLDLVGALVETEIPEEYRWNSDEGDVSDERRGVGITAGGETLQEIEGFARLDAGLGVDADEMIAKARMIVSDARRRKAAL